jgi:hypothetical protein
MIILELTSKEFESCGIDWAILSLDQKERMADILRNQLDSDAYRHAILDAYIEVKNNLK